LLQKNGNLVLKTPPPYPPLTTWSSHFVTWNCLYLGMTSLYWGGRQQDSPNYQQTSLVQKPEDNTSSHASLLERLRVMWCILIQGWKLNNKVCLILLDSFHQKKYLTFTVVSLLSWIRCNGAVGTSLYAGGPEFESWLEGQVS
jgi:hypothetical protein